MIEPVEIGFGHFMEGFYSSIIPSTKPLIEYVSRGFSKSVAWAPSRMVDEAEKMLATWQKNDTEQADTQPTKLPAIIAAISKDYTPTGREFGRQVTESTFFTFPQDLKSRCFGVRLIAGDIRAQVAIFAADTPTAKSLASQFCLYIDNSLNRRFVASYQFAGITNINHHVTIESPDTPVVSVDSGSKNIVIMALDLTLKASIPLFDAPKVGEPNDGKGVPGTSDPAGYPLVTGVNHYVMDPNL